MARFSKESLVVPALLLAAVAVVLVGGIYSNSGSSINSNSSSLAQATTDDWPAYMYGPSRSGFNAGETHLSPDNASNLKLIWKQKLGNVLAAQPIVKGDTVYEGSWDGFLYALNTKDGSVKWKADLGKTTSNKCSPDTAGITSAPAVTDKAIYIGGGDQYLYALDPKTGNKLWKFQTGDNSPDGGAYNWTSPIVYNGRVYYGVSAFCDKPFPHGEMWGINADTGKVEQHVNFVPEGQRGGGLWTSATVDESTGAFFVTTGSGDFYIPNSYSMARLDPSSLSVTQAWQIPTDDQVFDGDWGTTPTLFRDSSGSLLVGAAAKNGYYYAFQADKITQGPAWRLRIADGGECPQCGEGAISSSVYAYDTIYVAAGYLSLGLTQKFAGTVHALDPSTGAIKWIHPTAGSVIPALAAANGLVVAAGEDTVEVLNAATGELLWEYATGGTIYAAPSIAGGMLYVASIDGYLYAFSAGPYGDKAGRYKIEQVGSNPPGFTPYRKLVPSAKLPGAEQCFPETNHCARGDFLQFWRDRGGIERFGPAVTDELNEAGRTVQYFRNGALEIGDQASTLGSGVHIGKLDFRLAYFTPQDDHFEPARPISGSVFITSTQHNMLEPFLSYWRAHGDVANLGFPVSEPFDETNVIDGQTRRVQYFERSRLELVEAPNGSKSVAAGALGIQKYKQRYGKLP